MRKSLRRALLVMVGVLSLGAPPALAQQAKKAAKKDKKDPIPVATKKNDGKSDEESPKVQVERGAGGKKVYVIKTGFVIEGRIQKPNAFYVLQRSQINYDWAALKQDFVPNILDSVRKSPF